MLYESESAIKLILPYLKGIEAQFPSANRRQITYGHSYMSVVWQANDTLIGSLQLFEPHDGFVNKFRYSDNGSLLQVLSFEFNDWTVRTIHRSRSFVVDIRSSSSYGGTLAMIYYLDGPNTQRVPVHCLDDFSGMRLSVEPEHFDQETFSVGLPLDFEPDSPFLLCGDSPPINATIDPKNDHIQLGSYGSASPILLSSFSWRGGELFATSNSFPDVVVPVPIETVVL